jgi:uncharacterized protein
MTSSNSSLSIFDASIVDRLACPACLGRLSLAQEQLLCAACLRTYPILDGIPVLIAARTLANHDSASNTDSSIY